MKKIALDLDGVVFDSENLYRVYTEIYDVDKFGKDNLIDNSPRIFQQRYNWQEEMFREFYQNNAKTVLQNANVMTGADVVIQKLIDNFEIIIVTARSDDEVSIAKEKLKTLCLGNIKIYNNEHSKIQRFIDEKCDYIIDDDETICCEASKMCIKSIYFKNAASNSIEESEYLKVVNNWGEIYKYLILDK